MGLGLALVLGLGQLRAQDAANSANVFRGADVERPASYFEEANPWGGVDTAGNLRCITANQLAVDDFGHIGGVPLSPGVALGDLNGDGLVDLVVADPKGFFWYFPNSGSKTMPVFTHGEVMPVWLGDEIDSGGATRNYVPRIQLVDIDGSKKLGMLVGTYTGKLYFVPNTGSTTQPRFETSLDLSQNKAIPTRVDGRLDCNYFSPYLFDWFHNGVLQMLRGDGTYSANSIYFFLNKGTNVQPSFNEDDATKIIPGLGREHLTPQVIDWNNDGKPDVITGTRTGNIEVFLNTSSDPKQTPTFDEGQKIKIGFQDKFGQFTTVTTGSLTGNPDVPDLIFSNDTGEIFWARNTGTPGAPNFPAPPEALKGTNPFPKVLVAYTWMFGEWRNYGLPVRGWSEGTPWGVPYELLVVTNAQQEPGFAPPPGVTWKNAIRYEALVHKNVYFPTSYYPRDEQHKYANGVTQAHYVHPAGSYLMDSGTTYEVSVWMKGNGIRGLICNSHGRQNDPVPDTKDYVDFNLPSAISLPQSWTHVTFDYSFQPAYHVPKVSLPFDLTFNFYGQGNLYMSDLEVQKK